MKKYSGHGKTSNKNRCQKRQSGKPSLVVSDPAIAKTWHPTKNGALKPGDVTRGSNKKAYWRCEKDHTHVWSSVIANRVRQTGCPICLGKIVIPQTSLLEKHPKVAAEWHSAKNNGRLPVEFSPKSGRKVWWRCSINPDHQWDAVIASRTQENPSGCPYCARKIADRRNNLAKKFPLVAKEWHPTKNGNIKPNTVLPQSNNKHWFICGIGHEYNASVYSRTYAGTGCPMCTGRIACRDNSLSSIRPDIASEWDPNNDLTPDQVTTGSHKIVGWVCKSNPEHKFSASIYSRVSGGNGCPYCSNQAVSPDNCMAFTHPGLAEEMHPDLNGDITPEKITAGSTKSVWWVCGKNMEHVWEAPPIYRRGTPKRRGTGCPFCSNQISDESALFFDKLKKYVPDLITERSSDTSLLKLPGMRSRFDSFSPSLKAFIEYDGWYWHKDKYDDDIRKSKYAHKYGYSVMRIRQGKLKRVTALDVFVPRVFDADIYINLVVSPIRQMRNKSRRIKITLHN